MGDRNNSGESSEKEKLLSQEFVVRYDYQRSLGEVLGRFFAGLKNREILGARTPSGRVLVPPAECDPETGDAIDSLVDVGPGGVLTTWAWMPEARENQPVEGAFAWGLIQLDGADTSFLHMIRADFSALKTGMRVEAHWKDERKGAIGDIAYFAPETRP